MLHKVVCGLIFEVLLGTFSFGTSTFLERTTALKLELTGGEIHLESNKSLFVRNEHEIIVENEQGSVIFNFWNGTLIVSGPKAANQDHVTAALIWKESEKSTLEITYFTDGNVMITSWLNEAVTENITGKPLSPYTPIINYYFDNSNRKQFNFSLSSDTKLSASASIFCRVTALKHSYSDTCVQLGNDVVCYNSDFQSFIFRTPQYIVDHRKRDELIRDFCRRITIRDKITLATTILLFEDDRRKKFPTLSLDFDHQLNVVDARSGLYSRSIVTDSHSYVKLFSLDRNGVWEQTRTDWSPMDHAIARNYIKFPGIHSIPCTASRTDFMGGTVLSAFLRTLFMVPNMQKDVHKLGFGWIDYPYSVMINEDFIHLSNMNTLETILIKDKEMEHCKKVDISISYDLKVFHALCWQHNSNQSIWLKFDLEHANKVEEIRAISRSENEVLLTVQYTENKIHAKMGLNEVSTENSTSLTYTDGRFIATESKNEWRYFGTVESREIIMSAEPLKYDRTSAFYACIAANGVAIKSYETDVVLLMNYDFLSSNKSVDIAATRFYVEARPRYRHRSVVYDLASNFTLSTLRMLESVWHTVWSG